MDAQIQAKVQSWLNSNISENTKSEINSLLQSADETELIDCFYKDLEFGTGGLRGIMGVGSNRMNQYTIGMATQGLANYLKSQFNHTIKVAIAHDSRNNSRFFAETTASVFIANGIEVHLFEELRPTPQLSFAIRHLGCQAGVVITASHNPKEYNGYKAYWNDGAQLVPPHDKNVITEVQKIKGLNDVKYAADLQDVKKIGKEMDDAYLTMLKGLSLNPAAIYRQKHMKIVYSSIHGTGITLVPTALKQFGFENIHVVDDQATPDGNFPTVVYPNPEESEAMSMGLKLCENLNADILMATDPDSDRVGIAVKNNQGQYQLLNGNQTAVLLIDYLLSQWKSSGKLAGKEYIVKTIVTTEMLQKVADYYQVPCYNTLTGFKYIAELIKNLEGKETFIGGGEESYGYLIGDAVRDKDAIASCAMIAEMAAYTLDQGMTVWQKLMQLYQTHGLYLEALASMTKKGKSGAEEIKMMMKNYRENAPKHIDGSAVTKMLDYEWGVITDFVHDKQVPTGQPLSDVLQFETENGSKISIRPSGTEPKIKFYFGVREAVTGSVEDSLTILHNRIKAIKSDLGI